MNNAEQREQLRIAVLNFLALRHQAAFTDGQVCDRLRIERALDFSIAPADVAEACDLLVKLDLVRVVKDLAFSVLPHYQATGKGVIESETWRQARSLY